MIALTLTEKPKKLTLEKQNELTQKFLDTGESVWNKEYIKEAVFAIAFGKCAYSEVKLNSEGSYMEIDHFLPKKHFPSKVVEWGNLLPSCKKCNATKSEHNPENEPIINPLKDNPKDDLYIENYRYYGKTEKGKRTITVVALNDFDHFMLNRFEIGNNILEILKTNYQFIQKNPSFYLSSEEKIDFLTKMKNLMGLGNRKKTYSATISTIILSDENYQNIENYLKMNDLWDEELEKSNQELHFCALLK